MKLLILATAFLNAPAWADPAYESYCNRKFQFCVDYPKTFTAEGESTSGDGQKFTSGGVEITAYGTYNLENETPAKTLKSLTKELEKVTYKSASKNVVIVSGFKDGGKTVSYTKVLFQDDRLPTLIVTYPKDKKKEMDPVVTHVAQEFK